MKNSYVCYYSSTSPLVIFNKHRPNTSHQTIDFLDSHNPPTLISTVAHGQVRLMELQDICVQSCCRTYLNIKRSATIVLRAECFIQGNRAFLPQCIEQDVLSYLLIL